MNKQDQAILKTLQWEFKEAQRTSENDAQVWMKISPALTRAQKTYPHLNQEIKALVLDFYKLKETPMPTKADRLLVLLLITIILAACLLGYASWMVG